jgi:replicative DNA helicase
MPYDQLAQRMLSTGSRVPLVNIRTGMVEDMSDWTKVAKSVSELSQTKIFIDDTPNISVMEMMSRCRRLKLEHGLDIVMIDYLQLISGATGSGNRESRQVEVSEMARALKLMANELQVPVLLLSQLSRGPDQRENHRPILSDLRESGAIEQDADVVMFIYRGSYYEDYSAGNDAEIIVAKQRNGATGTVRLAWDGVTASFLNLDKRHNAQDFA